MDSGRDRTEELRAEFEANEKAKEKAKMRESRARAVDARERERTARADALNKKFHDLNAERQRLWEMRGARDEDRDR